MALAIGASVCALIAPVGPAYGQDGAEKDVNPIVDPAVDPIVDVESTLGQPDAEAHKANDKLDGKSPLDLKVLPNAAAGSLIGLGDVYDVGPIMINGARALDVTQFLDIIEAFSARRLSGQELTDLAGQIASRAHERGYVFASAWIEPQSLEAGVLRVRLDEGTVNEIRIEGADEPALRAQLAPLIDGDPITLEELERQILLADDISGVWIRTTRFVREGQRGILVINAKRQHFRASVQIENSGSDAVGPARARISAEANGLLTSRDSVSLTYSATPFQPGELQYGRLRYRVVVNSSGTELGISGSYSASRPGASLAQLDILGNSWAIGATVRHPLIRSRDFSLWFEGEVQMRELRQKRAGALYRLDRIPLARVGLYAAGDVAGGKLRGRLTYSHGLNILNATQFGDSFASRLDASSTFSKLSAWANWTGALAGDFSLSLEGLGQIASTPLLISEDVGLGGRRFLRGYSYSQRSGDEGIMASAELRYNWKHAFGLVRNVQFYTFADGGSVSNLAGGYGSGTLASGGGGVRTDITRNLDFDLELAVPFTGVRYDTRDHSPQFNLRLKRSF